MQHDPRYWQQLSRRLPATAPEAELDGALTPGLQPGSNASLPTKKHKLKRDWSEDMGKGATVGAGQYPGKFSFDVTTYNCSTDFVVFNTSLAGSSGQAGILAYNNLYHGCGGTVPSVYWAYDTGGAISTSVTLSPDGTQLAFVQNQGGVATVVLLKWKASTTESAKAPLSLSTTAVGSYRDCAAPCMTTIAFHATPTTDPTPTDTYSAPFYDFSGSDTLYVGDDAGYLHQFTNVFITGTPAETTATWPVEVGTAQLSSPVYDSTTGNVFVTTSYVESVNSGGRLAAVCATSACAGVSNGNVTTAVGTVTPSGVLGPATSGAVCHGSGASGNGSNLRLDSPIVDPAAGMVYAFLGNDGNGNSAVIQFPTTVGANSTEFSYHNCGTESTIGTGSTTGVPVFAGTFDNVYFTSSGSSPSGNLYVCGNTSADATLYQVRINSNAIATSGTSVLALSTRGTTCSPVTEVFNSPADWIFLSVEARGNNGSPVGCPSNAGCVMSFSVPTTLTGPLPTATTAALFASGGTSGIEIDNIVPPSTVQTSQVYYSTISNRVCGATGTGACAVQASQSGLK